MLKEPYRFKKKEMKNSKIQILKRNWVKEIEGVQEHVFDTV